MGYIEDNSKYQTHPSFGMISFSRRHGSYNCTPLFGSSIKHRDTISLVLKEGEVQRFINHDWYHGGKTLFEIELSGEQFANLLTNMNCGDGVPCTIRYTEKLGHLDYFDVPFEDKLDVHEKEFNDNIQKIHNNTKELIKIVREKFNKKTFNKSDKKEILDLLLQIEMGIGTNKEYELSSFNEEIQKIKVEAKSEIEMFWQNKLLQIAQQALVENPEKFILENKDNMINSPIEIDCSESYEDKNE